MTDPQGLAWRVLPRAAPRPTDADTRGGGGRRGMRTLAEGAAATKARGADHGGGEARAAPAPGPDTLEAQRTGRLGWVRRSRLARRLRRA